MKLEVINRKPELQRFETPLLFVHGTGHAAWCWDEFFLTYFANHGFNSYAVSLRGHGTSEGREKLKWASIADYVSDVAQVVSGLTTTPVLIGHSLGGLVVQKYLEKFAAPASVLVVPSPSEGMFLSGFFIFLKQPWLLAKVMFKQDYAVMFATPELAKKFLFSPDAELEQIAGFVNRFGPESYWANLETIFNLPRVGKIKSPMLVLGAEKDALVSPKKIAKTARVFQADYKIFPNMGHDLMLEKNWQSVADFMIDWLERRIK
jgi:pimeloyl-ACP methyl ester carboxylesterase